MTATVRAVLRLLGIVLSIGLADSVNPSTAAPALYLASGQHAVRRVLEFTLGVFLVSLLGGAIVVIGPGQLLLDLIPHPRASLGYWLEMIAGTVLLVASGLLWRFRAVLVQREMFPARSRPTRSSLLLGAGLMGVELPTAFPYFAALAAIVGSGRPLVERLALVGVYNVVFVLPLLAVAGTVALLPGRAEAVLARWRRRIETNWPTVAAVVLLLAGLFVIVLGATGLAGHLHGGFGHFARRVRHYIS